MVGYGRFCLTLIAVFVVIWAALAVAPHDRADWLLENFLTFLAVPLIVLSFWGLPLSRISYFLIFVFLCLHSLCLRLLRLCTGLA